MSLVDCENQSDYLIILQWNLTIFFPNTQLSVGVWKEISLFVILLASGLIQSQQLPKMSLKTLKSKAWLIYIKTYIILRISSSLLQHKHLAHARMINTKLLQDLQLVSTE